MKFSFPILCLLILPASAHHGQDFFLNLDARVPAALRTTAFMSSTWNDDEGWSIEPGILTGLGAGFAAGITASFSDTPGNDASADAVTPQLQWSLPLGDLPFYMGVSVAYHFADEESGDGHNHTHRTPRFNPDAPPVATITDLAPSIHSHGVDALQSRIIMEWEMSTRTRWIANVVYLDAAGSDPAWGYSVGLRQQIAGPWSIGIEALGDFNRHLYQEVAAGVIYSPTHHLGVRLGCSQELGNSDAKSSLLWGLTYRF